MTEIKSTKQYDLEKRTLNFAKEVRVFIKNIPKIIANFEDAKQVIRSSGSIGANYIEANESLSKKDFLMRIKICRKEAKETAYFLRLLVETNDKQFAGQGNKLATEATEFKKMFSTIVTRST